MPSYFISFLPVLSKKAENCRQSLKRSVSRRRRSKGLREPAASHALASKRESANSAASQGSEEGATERDREGLRTDRASRGKKEKKKGGELHGKKKLRQESSGVACQGDEEAQPRRRLLWFGS